MTNIIPLNDQLPAHLQASKSDALSADLMSGLAGMGFPVLSIRGRTWRIKTQGEEMPLIDRNENPIPAINVVILGSNKKLAKVYYAKTYSEGDDAAPDCWSMDGDAPDPGVEKPMAPSCQKCPMNVWGSKITPQGKKTRACSDTKRLAVVTAIELLRDNVRMGPMLLRVPPASLAKGARSLRGLIKDAEQRNAQISGLVVKTSFDIDADYPKINFEIAGYLPEDVHKKALELSKGEVVQRIIHGMEEAPINEPTDEAEQEEQVEVPETPAEVQVETEAADALESLLGGGEEQATEQVEQKPPQKRQRKKAAAKKKAAKKPEPVEVEVETAQDSSGFDDALSDLAGMLEG